MTSDFPAWAEQTHPQSLAYGAWYVWYSDTRSRSVRRIVQAYTGGFEHQSPSANEMAANQVAAIINEAYQMGVEDAQLDEENLRSGKARAHITANHPDGRCACSPREVAGRA